MEGLSVQDRTMPVYEIVHGCKEWVLVKNLERKGRKSITEYVIAELEFREYLVPEASNIRKYFFYIDTDGCLNHVGYDIRNTNYRYVRPQDFHRNIELGQRQVFHDWDYDTINEYVMYLKLKEV